MRIVIAVLVAVAICAPADVRARRVSHCIAIADAVPGVEFLHKASWRDPVPDYSVRISYIAHASFLIQTPGGLNAVTDYTGYVGNVDLVPDVVTMNHAHETHWTPNPDPAIPHVLKGWGEFGRGIDHYLEVGDLTVRNVPTDIRSGFSGIEPRGNSIFVFESEGLCIGHLGHLHHIPGDEQFAALGRLDVVMAPVDGGMTLPLRDMITTLRRLRSSIVIPSHWFGSGSLAAFLEGISGDFAVDVEPGRTYLDISLRTLPSRPTVVVLEPAFLSSDIE